MRQISSWPDYRAETGAIVIGPLWGALMRPGHAIDFRIDESVPEIRIAAFRGEFPALQRWKNLP